MKRFMFLAFFASLKTLAFNGNAKPPDALTVKDPFDIRFYTPVTTESCAKLATALVNLDKESKVAEIYYGYKAPIKLHMQSLGGELLPSIYVCDLILSIETPVHVYIDGFVASAASLMAVCGQKRYITPNSRVLIHQLKSQASGKLSEMRQEVDNLSDIMKSVKSIYLKNSFISENELDNLLTQDIWILPKKCKDLGFVDEIIDHKDRSSQSIITADVTAPATES